MEQSLGPNGDDLTHRSGKRKRKTSDQSVEEDEDFKTEEEQEKKDQEEAKQEAKNKLVSKHWSCPACTFLNETSRCFCEMCETPNPSTSLSAARSAISASEWSCAACTMVNPTVMRGCAVCGTLNPRPVAPLGLSISRISESLGDESVSSCSEDSDEKDSDSDEEDEDEADEEKWSCKSCNTQSSGRTCLNCCAQRPKVAGKIDNAESKEKKKQAFEKKRKRRKREKKLHKRAKIAYGVSIYELEKMSQEPISSRLVDTLQSLTHTLAMMDASADNEWADGSSFLIRSFGSSSSSATAKNPELVTVLANIFYGHERTYPAEVRLLAVQSINYLMKMDRHMFARSKIVEVVRLYITELLAWKHKTSASASSSGVVKSGQMIVEECLSGLSSICSTEGFALREVMAQGNFVGYLSFLLRLVNGDEENYRDFHPSIVMTALGILQKCCMKLRWSGKCCQQHHSAGNATAKKPTALGQVDQLTLGLATKLIDFLRHVLQHKHVPLHVKAAKCLLLIFHRTPYDCPEVMAKLVTSEVLRKFVSVVVNTNSDESEESRLAMVTLLLHLFDDRPQLVSMFVREKIYTGLFSGILPLLQSSSGALRTNALKLTSMLTRVVCRKHSLEIANSSRRSSMDGSASGDKPSSASTGSASRSPQNKRNRQRLNSLPDPDVLSTLLLDFIRADSIAAVNVLLKDGADLNAPKLFDVRGNEFDKPLNVAVECASLGMVRLLLKRGADVHQVGIGGTALHVAARTGRCHIAAFLLQCGARVQAKDREKKTVLDVVNLADKAASGDNSTESVTSPMKKLLELHQRPDGMQDNDSDLSEGDEMSGGRSRAWFYASDQDDEYEDDDGDDTDDDELEGEEGYYMDYDEDDEDDLEGFEEAGQYNEEMSGHSDDDMINTETQPSERRPDSNLLESEIKLEGRYQNANGDSSKFISRSHAFSGNDKCCPDDDVMLEYRAFSATADEVYEFSVAITQCLLAVLHDMDIQNVERSVISTVACVLEMAPSQLIRTLKEVDVVLILDTVHFLLQGEKLHQASATAPTSSAKEATSRSSLQMATHGGAPSAAHNLPSFILAVRILDAVIRKSSKKSSLFHQIERRGIREQIELLNNASACWVSTTYDGNYSRGPCDTIFGRCLNMLSLLWSDVLESGMLHLHKLRNLARRLKDLSDKSRSCDKELILIDLVDLFEQPNSITTYEFKRSQLLPAVLQYLTPRGKLDEPRALALMRAFERCPSALKHLIFRLQSIITQEETFPLISFSTGKGRELYPLTQQIKITFVRPGDINAGDKQPTGDCDRPKEKSIQSLPLTHFQSFEKSVFRCMPVIDSDLSLLYRNLVGHSIQKVVDGKWRKFLIVGYDDTRSYHLVKPIGGTDDDLDEMVLHDSQCKLIGGVEVYENVALDLTLFGSPNAVDTGRLADGKKKRKNKRKRKSATQKQQHDSESTCQVEAKNAGMLKMAKLPGAWYAAILVNDSGETCKLEGQTRGEVLGLQGTKSVKEIRKLRYETCEEVLASQVTHSVKVLADNRIIRNVPADCLRPRTLQPQVGSVVELDGVLGEVIRIYSNHCSSSGAANVLLDVKMDSGTEKSRVKKDRVRFPARQTTTLTAGEEGDRIEAMSMRRLFPARDSSLVGNIGDRVWVLPPSGSQIAGLCVAGTIKSFPSGSASVRESTTAIIEISFGLTQPPLAVKVNQDRILNFAVDGGILSGCGPSRLLAALQMASGRGRSSRLFGGGQTGQDGSTSAIHRAVERVTESLQQRRHGGGQGLSGTAMDQLRSFISRNSTSSGNVLGDVSNADRVSTTTHDAQLIPSPNEPIGSEVQTEDEASTSAPSCFSTLRRYLKPQCAKPKTILLQLPKVSLVVGFRKCDATSVTEQDRVVVSSELGLKRVDKSTACKDTPAPSFLIQLNSSTQRYKASAGARKALLEIFNSFSVLGSSQEKKRRKLSHVGSQRAVQIGFPWDIEKFIAFMKAVHGPANYGHTESIAKYCIIFSKYADPDTNRRLLKSEGFISFVVHECKDATKLKQMLKFLRSRGYSEKFLASSASRCSSGDDQKEEKDSSDTDSRTAHVRTFSNKVRHPLVLRGFPADQNVLKCVEELRHEHHTRTCTNSSCSDMTSTMAGTSLPPWKLTYELYCDFQVEWMAQSFSKTSVSDLVGLGTKSVESFSAKAAKPPTRLLSCGIVTFDSDDATEESRWLGQIIGSQACNSTHNGIVVPDSVASAVRLLRYLFHFRADVASSDEALWTSPRLYNKLERQMQDVLSMCSGIYPPWCDELVTHCKFFFPRDLRERLFRSTSFGCTRSLHWFRNQLNIDESSADSGVSSMVVGGGIYNQEISISPVPKERVKVYRENILQSAEAVMKMHAKRKAVLDVVFVGEKGYGTGVTAAFYSTIAHALQMITENQKNKFWVPGEDDEAETVHRVDAVGDIADDTPVIRHSNGLFPYPHRTPSRKLVERFRTMGRLAGKALMDERLLPLPLSPQFMKLVVGESFGLEELNDIFLSHGRILYSMYKASEKLIAVKKNVEIDHTDVQEWLGAVGFTFIDPFSQEPLVVGGEDIAVTSNNMTLYVQSVLDLWLDSGIRAQVLAFREGISEVLPLGKLRLLFVPELLSLLCGEDDIKWTVDSLTKNTKLAHGYTKGSQPVQFLFEVLEEMPATERRKFLLHATGCPNLPPGGFQALKPQFEVVRRIVENSDVDHALPFARTCTNTLHLPAYSSKAVLAKQLTFAIANSRGVIDRD
ncbi:unnamed protein product [Peronospora effusa]|nr:unnamed protein product [Peronospora effusa]